MKKILGISPLLLATGTLFAQDVKPNIVFILADDLGWKDLACYGNRFTETPNLDGLAKSGILFTQAYAACPVSSPTRASILTGKYPARRIIIAKDQFSGTIRISPISSAGLPDL